MLAALYDARGPEWVPDRTVEQARAAKLYEKLAECGRHAKVFHDENSGDLVVSTALCKSRVCPRCSKLRALRVRESISEAAKDINSPRSLRACRSLFDPQRDHNATW